MLWSEYTTCLDQIERVSGRIEITRNLSALIRGRTKEVTKALVYLSIARVSEEANGLEISVGEHLLLKSLSILTAKSLSTLRNRIKQSGDIASEAYPKQALPFLKRSPLTVLVVYSELEGLLEEKGKESSKRKTEAIAALLAKCTTHSEAKYIIRILDGKLKVGLSIQTVLAAVALTYININPEKTQTEWSPEEVEVTQKIKNAYSQLPSLSRLIDLLYANGLTALNNDLVTPGYPLKPMLAQAEKNSSEALKRLKGRYIAEYKYDGERAQVHMTNGTIKIFSRGLELTTERFSSLIEPIKKAYQYSDDFIIDCEVVAYNRSEKRILDFQTLSNRKRKLTENNSEKEESEVALFIFDILFKSKALTTLPLLERKKILSNSFTEVEGELFLVDYKETETEKEIDDYFKESKKEGYEGIMLKSIENDSTYEPSKRSQKWIKIKADYEETTRDTFDLLVLGAYFGKGKRKGTYGGFLLGCLSEEGEIETVTKIGTGFSESDLIEMYKELEEYKVLVAPLSTPPGLEPDVWFTPKIIWEVTSAGVSLSPNYTAGASTLELPEGKGLSLRFPRFLRKRPDKAPEDATTATRILKELQ